MCNAPLQNTPQASGTPCLPILKSLYEDKTVWRMADVYRKMVDTENNLAVNRRNWYIGINTFLGGILGLSWSHHCPCPCYSHPVLFLSAMGIIAAILFYFSSNVKYKAIKSILCRWHKFLYCYCQSNYEQLAKSDCPISKGKCLIPDVYCQISEGKCQFADVNKDYIFPPIIGLFEEPKCLCQNQPVALFWGFFGSSRLFSFILCIA